MRTNPPFAKGETEGVLLKDEALQRNKKEDISGSIDKTLLKIETFIDTTPLNPPFCKVCLKTFHHRGTEDTEIHKD